MVGKNHKSPIKALEPERHSFDADVTDSGKKAARCRTTTASGTMKSTLEQMTVAVTMCA